MPEKKFFNEYNTTPEGDREKLQKQAVEILFSQNERRIIDSFSYINNCYNNELAEHIINSAEDFIMNNTNEKIYNFIKKQSFRRRLYKFATSFRNLQDDPFTHLSLQEEDGHGRTLSDTLSDDKSAVENNLDNDPAAQDNNQIIESILESIQKEGERKIFKFILQNLLKGKKFDEISRDPFMQNTGRRFEETQVTGEAIRQQYIKIGQQIKRDYPKFPLLPSELANILSVAQFEKQIEEQYMTSAIERLKYLLLVLEEEVDKEKSNKYLIEYIKYLLDPKQDIKHEGWMQDTRTVSLFRKLICKRLGVHSIPLKREFLSFYKKQEDKKDVSKKHKII